MVRPRGRVDEEFIRIRRSTASTTARWRICPSDSGFTTSDTFLTRLGHSSADAFTIMKAAGHGSVVISQRYVHPTPERLETALTNLEAYNKQQSAELAEMGLSDQTIMSIAGHVSQEMLAHYSHIRLDAKRNALEGLNRPSEQEFVPAREAVKDSSN